MWTDEYLDNLLTTPSAELVSDVKKIAGDVVVLGAGGKMGPTLSALIKNACAAAGVDKKVTAVSRFSDPLAVEFLRKNGVGAVSADMLEPGAMSGLPDAENVIFMAGRKFGTDGQEYLTWAMNTRLPSLVAERYKNSNIVVFSSGNIYPMRSPRDGGADEKTPPDPVGEYAMSCLGRERNFEYAANTYGTHVCFYRLNYAVDLRYGVLHDIAQYVLNSRPLKITAPVFNCIWQGDANETAIRCLTICESPANRVNVTGPETVSVKWAAEEFGKYFGKEPIIEENNGNEKAILSNSAKMSEIFGYPKVSVATLIRWQAEWLLGGGRVLNKPTHFEEQKGKY